MVASVQGWPGLVGVGRLAGLVAAHGWIGKAGDEQCPLLSPPCSPQGGVSMGLISKRDVLVFFAGVAWQTADVPTALPVYRPHHLRVCRI